MKRIYRFYPILSTMVILLITGRAGAFVTGDGKSVYGGDRQGGLRANDPFLKASTPLRDLEAVPEGLTKTGWGRIRVSIERDRYRLERDELSGAYQAPNHANGLGGKLGFIAILHTWDQKLNDHFHFHCLIPGGAVSKDWTRWTPYKNE